YFALTLYADWHAFEPLSADVTLVAAGLSIRNVAPGSTLARAGLRDGDVLTAVNGQPVRGVVTWTSAMARLEEDRPMHVVFDGGGIAAETELRFHHAEGRLWDRLSRQVLIVDRAFQAATLITAVWIASQVPSTSALLGAWFLATVGVFSTAM